MEKIGGDFGFCNMNYEYLMKRLVNIHESFLDEELNQYTLERYLEVSKRRVGNLLPTRFNQKNKQRKPKTFAVFIFRLPENLFAMPFFIVRRLLRIAFRLCS